MEGGVKCDRAPWEAVAFQSWEEDGNWPLSLRRVSERALQSTADFWAWHREGKIP